ncbi:MAG: glycine cleavage system aminomethyltransferase GcvT [Planctomycetaceae bacterium]
MNLTPLNSWHHSNNGRMVDFAGWQMPVQYSSIVDEHTAVRTRAGLFDISHMGRLTFTSDHAGDFLNSVLTNDTAKMKAGEIRYSLVCREDGGILDDVLVYRLPDQWILVVNASNREKIVAWLRRQSGFDHCGFDDQTLATGMIAVQGPAAIRIANQLLGQDVSCMKYYSGQVLTYAGITGLVSRTGYTGEDGVELTLPAEETERIWCRLLELGNDAGVVAAGLGCRDTLRLEAAMPLYGHELSESVDPLTAGLAFAVKLTKSSFVGRDAILAIRERGLQLQRVGLQLESRRIAREETPVTLNGQVVGKVASGTFSPTLQQTIAMAYVPCNLSTAGTELQVDLRGTMVPATVVPLPFYRRS